MKKVSVLVGVAFWCGCGPGKAPDPVRILIANDTTHACAGAVTLKVTLAQPNASTVAEQTFAAAVSPEQVDCDFGVGVAEAVYSLMLGEIDVAVPHLLKVELSDSTGTTVAAGATEPFNASPNQENSAISLQLTRVAPLGTVLLDLDAEVDFHGKAGELTLVLLAGSDPVGSRSLHWPGDQSLKRPLRVSGLTGLGVRLAIELKDNSDTVLAKRLSDAFSLGSAPDSAFVWPTLGPG
jgi:hypothetical protein